MTTSYVRHVALVKWFAVVGWALLMPLVARGAYYEFSAVFTNGDSAAGTFLYDPATSSLSNISVRSSAYTSLLIPDGTAGYDPQGNSTSYQFSGEDYVYGWDGGPSSFVFIRQFLGISVEGAAGYGAMLGGNLNTYASFYRSDGTYAGDDDRFRDLSEGAVLVPEPNSIELAAIGLWMFLPWKRSKTRIATDKQTHIVTRTFLTSP